MLSKLKAFFEQHVTDAADQSDKTHALRLAAAALCVEVMRADYEIKPSERQLIQSSLQQSFDLDEVEARELISLAESEVDSAACLHPFTSMINAEYSLQQKVELIEILWRVALVDDNKDKYEEHLVRKVAELLYVPHSEFVQARHRAETSGPP